MVKHNLPSPKRPKVVFVGDLVDRGPKNLECLRLARNMIQDQSAYCVCGNHDAKFAKWLEGRKVAVGKGLETTVSEFENLTEKTQSEFREPLLEFLQSLRSHYVFDNGDLVVAHAGLKEKYHGRTSGRIREFTLFGDTDGTTDQYGMPTRENWAADYRGNALVVYGHTPVTYPYWENNTVNIDTGCVFGGKLTALKYPEMQTVSVDAVQKYFEPGRPITDPAELSGGTKKKNVSDYLGKQILTTRLFPRITLHADQSSEAFESINRFTVPSNWLAYLPPTMSPPPSSQVEGFLEHPEDVWRYFSKTGIQKVLCQKKHMGSRMIACLCKSPEIAKAKFRSTDESPGILYTRTGRKFFRDNSWTEGILSRLSNAMEKSKLWETLQSDWVLLDCEVMPWNTKADELIRTQMDSVANSARISLDTTLDCLDRFVCRNGEIPADQIELGKALLRNKKHQKDSIQKFQNAYQSFCWKAESIDDLRIAPFHILAAEDFVADQKDHLWHQMQLESLCEQDPILESTPSIEVDLSDQNQKTSAERWWLVHLENHGEGMVVKPVDWINFHDGKLVQPAIKCRGPEYLRIIYGPDYLSEESLHRLKKRSTGKKQSLALRQFALGLEALNELVQSRNLCKVHRCNFGILALNKTTMDPRL